MRHPSPERPLYLGMREGDLSGKQYAQFWNPRMAPLPAHARDALLHGPVAAPLLPTLADVPSLLTAGEQELENGYGFQTDGSLHVAINTELPGVSPAMVDWWFGWHSAEPQRYKLWHPRAHVHAEWAEPESAPGATSDRARYVGRISFVDEYLGSQLEHVAICFLPPAELGFDERALANPEEATVVCARIRLAQHPADAGLLVHHVRRVPGGAQMRSRFWLGGPYAAVRTGIFDAAVSQVLRKVVTLKEHNGRELLVHCSQEMSHLGSFLPRIHSELRGVP